MKLCECGCGEPAPIATTTRPSRGYVVGEPQRFVRGHRSSTAQTIESREKIAASLRGKKGPASRAWKGGRFVSAKGYAFVYAPDHPKAYRGYYVAEHRLVMEAELGRYLLQTETVHHKNGVRNDNRLENLELWTKAQPYGCRVDDLVEFVIENYRDAVAKALADTQGESDRP